MQFNNLRDSLDTVDFQTAVRRGLGRNQGLYFPTDIPALEDIDQLLQEDFVTRSAVLLSRFTGDSLAPDVLQQMLKTAFNFPLPLVPVTEQISSAELFHGPSLAFKDFGARFLAQCLNQFAGDQALTILTATSGDTGAAVAHAFHGLDSVRAVILYPAGRITPLQEKLFCTLGGNIHTFSVAGDFDACQAMVKQAFDDLDVRAAMRLNSANSINVARLLAQVCYYFEAVAQSANGRELVFSVPSGNFGNATAGLIARAMGLQIKQIIAATNENDTVPRFLESGFWDPKDTVATMTNAMDISQPNNFDRIRELAKRHGQMLGQAIIGCRISEFETRAAIHSLYDTDYLADPHSALAYAALRDRLADHQHGIFLSTAHPAKFLESLEATLGIQVDLPVELAAVRDKEVLSDSISADYPALKEQLLGLG